MALNWLGTGYHERIMNDLISLDLLANHMNMKLVFF